MTFDNYLSLSESLSSAYLSSMDYLALLNDQLNCLCASEDNRYVSDLMAILDSRVAEQREIVHIIFQMYSLLDKLPFPRVSSFGEGV